MKLHGKFHFVIGGVIPQEAFHRVAHQIAARDAESNIRAGGGLRAQFAGPCEQETNDDQAQTKAAST